MKVSIIIPTYKESENISELLNKIQKNLNKERIDFKILIVDDSPTKEINKFINKDNDNVRYIYRGKKLGRGSAVLEGFKIALNSEFTDIIVEMDADLSHDPEELNSKIKFFLEKECDLLISSRYTNKSKIIGWPLRRKILSYISNKLARIVLKIPVSDYTNGYRFYSKKSTKLVTENCGNIGDGFIVLSEILLQIYLNKLKICEIETIFKNRTKGSSSVNLSLILKSITGLVKLFFIKNKFKPN